MGSLTKRVVHSVSARPSGTGSTYTNTTAAYDYAIGGIPFLSANNPQRPSRRKTAPYRKDQIDQSVSPGEQSLVAWWLRSQLSFHGGTGIQFEEPDNNLPAIQYRFANSQGVDVFTTQGQVSLLKTTTEVDSALSSSGLKIMGATDSTGADCVFASNGTALKRYDSSGTGAAVTWGGTGTIVSLTQDGTNYYAADNVGIYQGTLAGGNGAKVWNTGSANTVISWMKQRLMAGIGASLYELTGVAGAPALPASGAAGNLYTHPNSNWQWTAFAETPSAMYAAGFAGSRSAIYKMTLNASNGTAPSIAQPTVVAELPPGELVYSLHGCLGTYLLIGTSKGVRIAVVDTNGDLQYGPLNAITNSPVYGITSYDRFVYFTWSNGMPDGTSGLGWIDLGYTVDYRRWAYSTNLQAHTTGTVRGVAMLGASGRLAFVVDTKGLWYQHATDLEPTGTLTTGNIRFHTLEPKLFKYLKLRAKSLQGTLGATAVGANGASSSIGSFTTAGATDLAELQFPTSLGPQEYAYLTFTLGRSGTDATQGPTLLSYQIKALPAQKNQRLIVLQLLCFDREKDREGTSAGYDGWSKYRLSQLEALEEARDVVTLQDLTVDGWPSRLVVIDDVDFFEEAPPARASGVGGYLQLTLRSVD